ncbi:MAG: hypothetical protein RIS70_2285 [Planctomycetota bacterium]
MTPAHSLVGPSWTVRSLALFLGLALPCLNLTGCGRWNPPPTANRLPVPRMSPDSVVLEIASVRLPVNSELQRDWWNTIDEQALPQDVRENLAQNGIRVGIISGEIPKQLRDVLAQPQSNRVGDQDPDSSQGCVVSQQRLQQRSGRRGKIVTSELRDEIISLVPKSGRVVGQTYYQAQCLFSIRSYPQGDGQLKLDLVPEIEHGQPRTRWIGQPTDGSFRLDTGRERAVYNELRFEPRLAAGEALILTCSDECKGLGREFFIDTKGDARMQRILLIRLAQTQLDDLFSPESSLDESLPGEPQ